LPPELSPPRTPDPPNLLPCKRAQLTHRGGQTLDFRRQPTHRGPEFLVRRGLVDGLRVDAADASERSEAWQSFGRECLRSLVCRRTERPSDEVREGRLGDSKAHAFALGGIRVANMVDQLKTN
jgi:hypothetical protein